MQFLCTLLLCIETSPLLEKRCMDCHDTESAKAKVILENAPFAQHSLWRRAEEQVRAGLMPPPSEAALSPADKTELLKWIGEGRQKALAAAPVYAPKATIRRLNRREYEACFEQLFGPGLFSGPGALPRLPSDDLKAGFDTIGSSLSVNPLWTRRHLEICRLILDRSLPKAGNDKITLAAASFKITQGLGQVDTEASLWTNGRFTTNVVLPAGGSWKASLFASCNEVGQGPGRARFWINGKAGTPFNCDESRKALIFDLDFVAGNNRLELEFLNDFADPVKKLDRKFTLNGIELKNTKPPSPAVKLLSQNNGLYAFARLAWRRQPSPAEWPAFVALAKAGPSDTLETALRRAVLAILTAPAFVFRLESRSEALSLVPEVELASRLSFFLSGAAPDDALLRSAETGKLRSDLKKHFDRLIDTSEALGCNLAGLGFGVKLLDSYEPQGEFAASLTPSLRNSARRQAELFVIDLIRRDRPAREIVDSSWTWLNQDLATHYKLPWSGGAEFKRVELPAAELRRGGLLGTVAFAAVTSRPLRTSPVLRGSAILAEFLARPPPPPPPNVGSLAEAGPAAQGTARERLAAHRNKPECNSCHRSIDPLGFALEELDPLGRFRAPGSDDFSGELPDGRKINGLRQLQQVLAAEETQIRRTMALKFFLLALGREPVDADEPLLNKLSSQSIGLREMLWQLINSDAFQKRNNR
jgi:Protein of unknown function (DUF1588)/Protein of unknown function (DUF1592)/Protein of unknown function (DUF1585)/Protein of unknown function (DUF1587)/Protein of unknown function (DUF1595)